MHTFCSPFKKKYVPQIYAYMLMIHVYQRHTHIMGYGKHTEGYNISILEKYESCMKQVI